MGVCPDLRPPGGLDLQPGLRHHQHVLGVTSVRDNRYKSMLADESIKHKNRFDIEHEISRFTIAQQ